MDCADMFVENVKERKFKFYAVRNVKLQQKKRNGS